jgi:uncharacterized lipoprotein YmbA
MNTNRTATWLMLAALLGVSACADKPSTMTLITPASQQMSAIKWEEAIAANGTAHVNNTSLIFMR